MPAARHIHAILVAVNLFWYQAVRQTLGVLSVSMGHELGYTTQEKGWLIAAPSVGNIITQAVGGRVEVLIGARATVAIALSGLGAGSLLLPMACSASLRLGLLVLAAQGFIFGPMFPTHAVLLSRWALPSERGWASAQGELAISLASMGAPLLIASLNAYAGWRSGFYAVGAACLAYVGFVWLRLAASRPTECGYISSDELRLLRTEEGSAGAAGGAAALAAVKSADKGPPSATNTRRQNFAQPAHRVLVHPAILAVFSCHMVYNLTTLSINSWMPSYYAEVLELPPDGARIHLTVPHLAAMVVKLGVAPLGTAVRARGVSLLGSRRLMCFAGYLGTAVPVLLVPALAQRPVWMTTACFSAALAGTGLHAEGFRANYLDVTRAHVGLVSGVGNCLSSVAAMVAPIIVGALVSAAGSWDPVWYCISAACLASAALFCTLSAATPVEELLAPYERPDAPPGSKAHTD